jgi:hypothetical protein
MVGNLAPLEDSEKTGIAKIPPIAKRMIARIVKPNGPILLTEFSSNHVIVCEIDKGFAGSTFEAGLALSIHLLLHLASACSKTVKTSQHII